LGGRFVSEFGMQGFPVMRTVDEYFGKGVKDAEKTTDHKAIEWHNKATGASDTLKKYDISSFRLLTAISYNF
jgi:beta-mannosidase